VGGRLMPNPITIFVAVTVLSFTIAVAALVIE
jgi:hypothetical protein